MLLRSVLLPGVHRAMQVTEAALSPVTGAQAHAVQLHANKFSATSN